MNPKEHRFTWSLTLVLMLSSILVLTACGTFEVNIAVPASPTTQQEKDPTQLSSTQIITQIVTPLPNQEQPAVSAPTPKPVAQSDSANDDNQPNPEPNGSQFWVEVRDDRTGIRFAMPCYWIAEIPSGEQDPSGMGSFPIKNYTEEFVTSFGPKQGDLIWENGAIKIDMIYIKGEGLGLPPGTSAREFAQRLDRGETEGIESIEDVTINGQTALLVTTYNSMFNSTHQSYTFALPNDIFMIFSVHPNSEKTHADVQGILQSLALTPEVNIQVPNFIPRQPPEGVQAACLKGIGEPGDSQDITGPATCLAVEENSPTALACTIQKALLTRDIAALETLMTNPFTIGYWQSEGRIGSPAEITEELDQYRLPADTSGLTFTVDREQFPYMYGMPPENMFGPDFNVALVIYSQGWGQDGQDEAILLITENTTGEYYWHGMIYAGQGFER
jgi:hypothetical protein